MKKLAAMVATGILLAGVTVSHVSAAEVEVHKGDSLWKISQEHNTTVEELMSLNNLQSTIIHPDQILVTSDGEDGDESTEYTVKKGDTLSGIGNQFDVTVKNLKEWNNLDSNILTIGQVLEINGKSAAQPVVETNEEAAPADVQDEAVQEEPKEEPQEEVTEEPEEAVNEEPQEEVNEEPEEEVQEPKQEVNAEPEQEVEEPKEKAQEEPQEEVKAETEEAANDEAPEGKTISVSSTAYTANCPGCSGVTATGIDLNNNPNQKVIAVDPDVIPLGSKVYVEGYGEAIAADTGGAINGDKIDVHVPNQDEASNWGVQEVNVTIVE